MTPIKPTLAVFVSTTLLHAVVNAAPKLMIEMGDGTVDGHRLAPYSLTWQQCAWNEGKRVAASPLHETLAVASENLYRLRQSTTQSNGIESQTNLILDRETLSPTHLEIAVRRDGKMLQHQEIDFGDSGYSGSKTQGEERTQFDGAAASTMFHGAAMGLSLAAMGAQESPVEFKASMVTFDATYNVIATWVGIESMDYQGMTIESQMVDVEWNHIESGDVYAPGPDASGGRYWIVSDPPKGFPYVPRYKTDSYAVEFTPMYCD